MAPLDPHIFRAYDIRGKAFLQITEEGCTLIGQAFGSVLRERYTLQHPKVIVGRDARTHSPQFEEAVCKGLMRAGCTVIRIGQTPSPVNYFALCTWNADGSIQITASHNAKDDNGLKLQVRNAEAFAGENLQELRRRIEGGTFLSGTGTSEHRDIVLTYIERVSHVCHGKNLKVVSDFGNGVAGPVYSQILRQAGVNLIPLFEEPDGTFPNHIADPTKHETLEQLRAKVKEKQADCGIAFDGDGDRVGFVDEQGDIVNADSLLLLLAKDHLKRFPGAPIIYTVAMSSVLETEIQRMGGTPVMCIVGHSFVEHAMREHGSHLGAEQSGHFFCGENFFDYDDALVAALRILSIFANEKLKTPVQGQRPLSSSLSLPFGPEGLRASSGRAEGRAERQSSKLFSDLFSQFPKTFQVPERRPHCPDSEKTRIVQAITKHFVKLYPVNTLDGARIDLGEGAWAGIRQSNTSPHVSICMEARTEEKLKEVEKIVMEHLKQYPEVTWETQQ